MFIQFLVEETNLDNLRVRIKKQIQKEFGEKTKNNNKDNEKLFYNALKNFRKEAQVEFEQTIMTKW